MIVTGNSHQQNTLLRVANPNACVNLLLKSHEGGARVKNAVFWDVTPCGCRKNRRFGGTYRLHHQGRRNQHGRNTVSSSGTVVPNSLILSTLTMEAILSSETLVLTRAIPRHIPEGGILHSHRRENIKSYILSSNDIEE
jgi:hypothetical protein